MPTSCVSEQAWRNIHLHIPAQSLWIVFLKNLVPLLSLSSLFLSPSHFLSSFPPCVEGLIPVLLSGWKGYSSLLDILLGCEYTSTDLHLVEKKRERGGVKKKKNTQSHIPWLHGYQGDMFSQWQRILTVSPFCFPSPPASPLHQLLLWLHPAQAYLLCSKASNTEKTSQSSPLLHSCAGTLLTLTLCMRLQTQRSFLAG